MRVKTHLIVTDQYDEYEVKWHKRLLDSNPKLTNGMPTFILIRHSGGRMELNTINLLYLEKMAKKFTFPKGRGSVTTDKTDIYIKEVDDNEKLMATVTHNHIRKYAPMYDEL